MLTRIATGSLSWGENYFRESPSAIAGCHSGLADLPVEVPIPSLQAGVLSEINKGQWGGTARAWLSGEMCRLVIELFWKPRKWCDNYQVLLGLKAVIILWYTWLGSAEAVYFCFLFSDLVSFKVTLFPSTRSWMCMFLWVKKMCGFFQHILSGRVSCIEQCYLELNEIWKSVLCKTKSCNLLVASFWCRMSFWDEWTAGWLCELKTDSQSSYCRLACFHSGRCRAR